MTPTTLPFVRTGAFRLPPISDPAPGDRPDLAVLAEPLFERATTRLARLVPTPTRWRVPAAGFWHGPKPTAPRPTIADEVDDLLCLCGTLSVRRAARARPELVEAARAAAPHHPAARKLFEALRLVEDEVFRFTVPSTGAEWTAVITGVHDFAQLAAVVSANAPPAHLPARVQFADPSRLADPGPTAWFWPEQPLARVPQVEGERRLAVLPATTIATPHRPRATHVTPTYEHLTTAKVARRQAA